MYLAIVLLLMLVLPVGSILAEHAQHTDLSAIQLVGRWFVFWAAGARLFLAGLRQFFQPRFTAEQIFNIKSDEALPLVSELGVANVATGTVGLLSLVVPSFVLPVAIAAGIFYGIAGFRHAMEKDRTTNENIAMVSDIFVFFVFAMYVGAAANFHPI